MKLYMRPIAPNAVKVLIFAAERGIDLETIDIASIDAGEFRRVNPLGTVPTLVTDSGLAITESLTICEYLEAVTPGLPLFGSDPEERARIAMWERRGELNLLNPAIEFGHHTHPMFAGHIRQFPDTAREQVKGSAAVIAMMEDQLARTDFLAGDCFTAADITAFLGYVALQAFGALTAPPGPAVTSWLARVGTRPSFAPLQALAAVVQPA